MKKNHSPWTSEMKSELLSTVKSSENRTQAIKDFAKKYSKSESAVANKYYTGVGRTKKPSLKKSKIPISRVREALNMSNPIQELKFTDTGLQIKFNSENSRLSINDGIISITAK